MDLTKFNFRAYGCQDQTMSRSSLSIDPGQTARLCRL